MYTEQEIRERRKELEEDIENCADSVKSDEKSLEDAIKYLTKSKVYWAEAIIALDKFNRQYEKK